MARDDDETFPARTGTTSIRVFRGPNGGVRFEASTGGGTPTVVTTDEISEANRQEMVRWLQQPTLIPPYKRG